MSGLLTQAEEKELKKFLKLELKPAYKELKRMIKLGAPKKAIFNSACWLVATVETIKAGVKL